MRPSTRSLRSLAQGEDFLCATKTSLIQSKGRQARVEGRTGVSALGTCLTRPDGARLEARASLLLSATEQSHDQLSIDGNCLCLPIGRGAGNGERSAGCGGAVECPGDHGAQDVLGQCGGTAEPLRHPLAELTGTAPNRLGGKSGENRDLGKQRELSL